MNKHKKISLPILLLMLAAGLFGCGPKVSQQKTNIAAAQIKHATYFDIQSVNGNYVVQIFDKDKHVQNTYFLYHDKDIDTLSSSAHVQIPIQSAACLSSLYVGMCDALGETDKIKAVDNINYIFNSTIIEVHKNKKMAELAPAGVLNIENTLLLKPSVLFQYGSTIGKDEVNPILKKQSIHQLYIYDHLEASPLARAEWIKFVGVFLNKTALADSLFNAIELDYTEQQKEVATLKKPTVFSEMKYSDTWYVPGGKSFMAKLLQDAGARYIFENIAESGSIPMNFEQVYTQVKDADYWLNTSMCKNMQDVEKQDKRYALLKAFKENKIFNNNLKGNAFGASAYWETGIIFPNKILRDMIHIFHPEVDSTYQFEYYQQLK